MWSASNLDCMGIDVLSFPSPYIMCDPGLCITRIELACHACRKNFIHTSHAAIEGYSMWLMITCYTLRAWYCSSWLVKPLTLKIHFGLIGKCPIRIQPCNDGRFQISASILPTVIHNRHNFVSPMKFLRNVWSDISRTGKSEEYIERLFNCIVSMCSHFRFSWCQGCIILAYSTTNHLCAFPYVFNHRCCQIPDCVQKSGRLHRHTEWEDIVPHPQGACNQIKNPSIDERRMFLSATAVDPPLLAFGFSISVHTGTWPSTSCIEDLQVDLLWRIDLH